MCWTAANPRFPDTPLNSCNQRRIVIINKSIALAALAVFVLLLMASCRNTPPNLVNSPADVQGKFIGVLRGTPSERLADELGSTRVYNYGEEMMAHLRAGAVDCAVMENSAAVELVADSHGVRILSEPLVEHELHFAVAKENAELLVAVNSALAALRQNGTLNGLSSKYYAGKSYTYVPPEGVEAHPGSLSLAVPPDSPPFSYKNAEGEFLGLDVEVARAVCDFLGVELRVIEYDAWELVNAVQFGLADLALGWLPSEGEDIVNISDTYADAVHVIVVRR